MVKVDRGDITLFFSEHSGFKVGDSVRVVRQPDPVREWFWSDLWVEGMDGILNHPCYVVKIIEYGVRLRVGTRSEYNVPHTVLEKVE